MTIDDAVEPSPEPAPLARIAASRAAQLPLAAVTPSIGEPDGMLDYARPLDPDLHLRDFATPVLRALDEEVCLQGQLLSIAFMAAVGDRYGFETAVDAGSKQLTGVAGVAADRLKRAYGLGADVDDVATVFSLHPAFRPVAYVDWRVAVDGDVVHLELGDCPARHERGLETWMSRLAGGHDRALSAIAAAVDPHWAVTPEGPCRWVVRRGDEVAPEFSEVTVTKFSTGVAFGFDR